MPSILSAFARRYQTTQLSSWLPSLIGFGLLTPCMVASTDEDRQFLLDLRWALLKSGLSDKQVADFWHVNKGLCSKKLSGEKSLSCLAIVLLPVDVRRWLAVRWAMRFGVPVEVATGARLQRRALRMALPSQKVGVA